MTTPQSKYSKVVCVYTILAVLTLVPACTYWWAQYLGYCRPLNLRLSPELTLALVILVTLPLAKAVIAVSSGERAPDSVIYTWFVLLSGVNMTLTGISLEAVGANSRVHDAVSRALLTWDALYIFANHFWIPGIGTFWAMYAYSRKTVMKSQVMFCTVPHLAVAVFCAGHWADQYLPYKLAPVLATVAVFFFSAKGVTAWYSHADDTEEMQREKEIYSEMRRQTMDNN